MKAITAIAVLSLVAVAGASAQGKSQTPRTQHTQQMSRPAKPSTPPPENAAPKSNASDTFKGVAAKLGTTPDALETAYETAKTANPKLSRGQFVAANMISHNLSAKNPAITTQAILDGLKSGKSLGQTLQGLGLNQKDAEDAEREARREAAAAQKAR